MTPTVGVVGLSHLGIVTSACLAEIGMPVIAVDRDPELVRALASGTAPLHEPGLPELLARTTARFTTDHAALAAADLVIIALDTVTDEEDRSDLSLLEAEIERALPWIPADGAIAVMSQVPVGYTRGLAGRLRARRPALTARVYHWAETLVMGDAVARFLTPERVILGGATADATPEPALDAVLARLPCPVLRMSWESAELTKAAINFYLSVSVTFANTLGDLAEAAGASMRSVVPALRSDRRIGPHAYVRPGLGLAGGNLERDLVHLADLAARAGADDALVRVVLDASARRHGWLTRAIDRHVFAAGGRRLAVWGLAYKKNTASTRNSASLRLLRELGGRASARVYDPRATLPERLPGVEAAASAAAAAAGADALVILTDWDEFVGSDPADLRAWLARPVVIDAVGALDAVRARAAGLAYVAVGEGAP